MQTLDAKLGIFGLVSIPNLKWLDGVAIDARNNLTVWNWKAGATNRAIENLFEETRNH